MAGTPPRVIKDAVARALVHYPFAGRLRELEGRKLAADCTGEGVLFVEANANDVRLEQFGDAVRPPFPCVEELLFDVPGSSALLSSLLLLFQVTRLACGGFTLAVRVQHAMADGQGMLQFLGAVAELARGAAAPTVWGRELLTAREPPRPSFVAHREYDEVPDTKGTILPPGDV
ncbi:10-deacetylbaccatin III 10-O-acetyltransferase [Panicum miliaceum]|uniref:10-deacetylbaccatin III 10-O-acetyltransferase n=1 Tax=Panicum miliaceum TaxID=4540 RepID=A0A3L6Q6A0_PANMI|nr:10-deacetylbaccatin III 10-O-acetyltransferase [Panicum miliaceum]